MSHVHLTKEDLIGSYEWKGNLDLLNIIMLGLAKNLPEHDETYELHRLLCALLSQELTIDEKLNINGFTVEQIAMATDKNVEEVKAIIAGKEPALA